jgi:hypothetical protein
MAEGVKGIKDLVSRFEESSKSMEKLKKGGSIEGRRSMAVVESPPSASTIFPAHSDDINIKNGKLINVCLV